MALGFEDLPPGFWDAPADEVRAALVDGADTAEPTASAPQRPARDRAAPPAPRPAPGGVGAAPDPGVAPETSPPADGDDDPEAPSPLEAAFNQLQSLFPGRVVEVLPLPTDAESAATSPLEDEFPATDGYDDDDQEALAFGPERG